MNCPNYPIAISRDDIIDYAKLIFMELKKISGDLFENCFKNRDKCNKYDYQNDYIIADQADSLVDIDYYSRNITCQFGIDLSKKYYEKYNVQYFDENNKLIENDDDRKFSEYVKIFTEESKGIKCSKYPTEIPEDKILFLTKMILSEIDELIATISNNAIDKDNLINYIFNSYNDEMYYEIIDDSLENQIDALVNIYHLSKNLAYKHGINLSKVFHEVHNANLRKKDPLTNRYIIRKSDGKILKPENWIPPDIQNVIKSQIENGSWN